mmetsp:Transcript_16941/g.28602  ORF Transcript_16941/g.28602 Transcript_16941/m.28602 type:complete len:337 (-) Transcript_16941:304-1314(-)|eukprot:CAMPEP_0198216060 /NCGR_PEP_ID=MMETSP1445-20131203/54489_1 /TAXON_ID=36898 /ORGANISM="Pyramimonas sp., Strain CCMP2087" /LENGTH=336 /DNA_ID=CAMNT_0043892097 /DNA_START=52 /DNA_END=1062 /DNA_ORIENTATION=+
MALCTTAAAVMHRTMLASSGSFQVPAMGCGAWSWGDDKGVWGWDAYDSNLNETSVASAFNAMLDGGVNFFDTAETYGDGLSETLTGKFKKMASETTDESVLIATKFQPGKWKGEKNVGKAMLRAAKESCARLGVSQIDLYQIHAPLHRSSLRDQGHALAGVVEAGLAKAVGVSNFSLDQMREIHKALAEKNVPLSSNQVEFSILRQYPLHSGMLADCDRLGVQLLAYSPMAMGRLTGKYSADNPPKGRRGFSNYPMEELQPLLDVLQEMATKYSKTQAQVALNWVMAKGAIPIPGAKNAAQAEENVGALGWALTDADVATLTTLGKKGGTSNWQHG